MIKRTHLSVALVALHRRMYLGEKKTKFCVVASIQNFRMYWIQKPMFFISILQGSSSFYCTFYNRFQVFSLMIYDTWRFDGLAGWRFDGLTVWRFAGRHPDHDCWETVWRAVSRFAEGGLPANRETVEPSPYRPPSKGPPMKFLRLNSSCVYLKTKTNNYNVNIDDLLTNPKVIMTSMCL